MLALIPARGGSKGVPGKNIKKLNGKPLIAYTIEAALNTTEISDVIVSTDCPIIADVAKEYGAWVPELRPIELATDSAKSIDVFFYVIDLMRGTYKKNIDEIIILQATSPFRNSYHISEAISIFQKKEADSVISYSEVDHPIEWCKYIDEEGKFSDVSFEPLKTNRQENKKTYFPNGAIYIFNTNYLLKHKEYYGEKSFGYIMDKHDSIDIDTPLDFEIADFLMKRMMSNV